MGVYYPQVMEWDAIKEIVPEEAAAIECILLSEGMDLDSFCYEFDEAAYWRGDHDDGPLGDDVLGAWKALNAAFAIATTVEGKGLSLQPYYDECGHFAVGGACEWTPAGLKYEDKIERG